MSLCWLDGELIPVFEIDGRKLQSCPGLIFNKIQRFFKDKIQAETDCFLQGRAAS